MILKNSSMSFSSFYFWESYNLIDVPKIPNFLKSYVGDSADFKTFKNPVLPISNQKVGSFSDISLEHRISLDAISALADSQKGTCLVISLQYLNKTLLCHTTDFCYCLFISLLLTVYRHFRRRLRCESTAGACQRPR